MSEARLSADFVVEYAFKRSTGPVVGGFLTALREGRIVGARTVDGRVICPPTGYDPQTGEDTEEQVEVGPEGIAVSVFDGWGLIRLDGADTAMVHRVEGVASGDRVVADFRTERVGSVDDIRAFVRVS